MSLASDFQDIQVSLNQQVSPKTCDWRKPFLVPISESVASHDNLLHKLGSTIFPQNSGHWGIGNVLMNLRIIGRSKQSFAILADANPFQVKAYDTAIEMIADKKTSGDFIKDYINEIDKNHSGTSGKKPLFFHKKLSEGMRCEKDYQHLRMLAQRGDIISLNLNLFDSKMIRDVSKTLHETNRSLGTIYLTNLTFFLMKDKDFFGQELSDANIMHFWDNIKMLSDHQHTLICDAQCRVNSCSSEGPSRRPYVQAGTWHERRDNHLDLRRTCAAASTLHPR